MGGPSPDRVPVELLNTGASARGGSDTDGMSEEVAGDVAAQGRTGVAVVGGLLIVVAMLWALGRPGETESVEQAAPSTSTTVGPTIERRSAPPTSEPRVFDAPVVGERTGLSLLIGGETPLRSLDLDSGDLVGYGVTAHPVLVTGGELVLYQEGAGLVGWVPLDDAGQQVTSWKRGRVAVASDPGLLWVLDPSIDEPHPAGADVGSGRWELFDTGDDRRVLQLPGDLYRDIENFIWASPSLGGVFDVLRPGPWFTNRRDGFYRAIDTGYIRLGPGRVIVNSDDAALVEDCTIGGVCTVAWFEVDTGEPVDRILPEVRPRSARMAGGGAWLHSVGWAGTSEFLELSTGRRIEHDWATERPAISPDGRWLAHWSESTLVISDLADGDPRPVVELEVEHIDGDSLLFASAPARRGLQSPPAS